MNYQGDVTAATGLLFRGAVVAVLLAAPVLNGCSGFVARKPQADPYEILTLRNERVSSVSAFSKYLVEPQALPIPIASPAEIQQLGKAGPSPAMPAAADIGPIGIDPNEVRATPPGQAVTQQSSYALDPITTIGRFNFTRANGQTRYCSAQLVGDTGVILTAAHCVFDGRFGGGAGTGWAIDIEYAFASGSVNPGSQFFDWECAAIFKGWALDSPTYDYAFVKLRGNATRALGLRASAFQSGRATSMGYPGNISSVVVSYVNATPALAEATILRHSPNPFGGGSSGGAWVDSDRAESLNSFGRSDRPNTMFGPIFSTKTLDLYDYVRSGCPSGVSSASVADATSQDSTQTSGTAVAKRKEPAQARQQFAAIEGGVVQATAAINKTTCACSSATPLFVSNLTESSRRVVVSARRTRSDGAEGRAAPAELDLTPREKRFLGCSKLEASCGVTQEFRIETSTRLRTTAVSAGVGATPTSLPVSIDTCVDRCAAGDSAWCQRLGARPSAALLPLAGLLKASGQPPDLNSVVLKRHEVISALGGDPSKEEDPCARSDVVLNAGRLSNSGAQCRVQSQNILDNQASELFLVLDLNSHLSWRKGVTAEAEFDRVNEEPYVEFGGDGSRALTDSYAGRIRATRIVKDGLVVSTENGCLMAVNP